MTRRKRPGQKTGALTALLVTGSLAATLAGTRLLARQGAAAGQAEEAAAMAATTVLVPAARANAALPPTASGVTLALPPIPQVVQPQIRVAPVARTRSSR